MKFRIATVGCAVFVGVIAAPAYATTTPSPSPSLSAATQVIDVCGNPKTGKLRNISDGSCTSKELSLGNTPISRGAHRPKHLIDKFYNRYLVAKAAGRTHGYSLFITSGWRSLAKQKYLYNRALKRAGGNATEASRWVLPPKKSNHPWGIAIDVNYTSGANNKSAAKWLEKNGYKFGLCRRYKNEWWHFEPLVAPGTKCPKMEKDAS